MWMVLISVLGVLLITLTFIFWVTKNYNILGNDYYQLCLIIAFVAIWTPLVSLYQVRRSFKSSYKLSELIKYEFSDEGYIKTGQSFNSKIDWVKVYKIQIIRGWLILYHSRYGADMIKIAPGNENNIEALKQYLKAGNFKAKLKW
jgi:hypothetical protein